MKKRLIVQFVLFAISALASPEVMAGNAGMLLTPTRIVLENGQRYITVIVRNNGESTGRYKIGMVDASMDENGGIKMLEDGKKDEFSAIDMVSISPSTMTLNPDEFQNVRLLIKNKGDLPDGEYRSHLKVMITESDLTSEGKKQEPIKGTGISVKMRTTTIIPVIIRKGQTSYNVTIDDAKLVTGGGEDKQQPEVKVGMSFSGNRSVLGDIKVTHLASDGKETQVAFLQGVAIYRNVAKRTQVVPLKVPEGVNVHSGRLRVDFLSQENEGSHVLSEKEITP
jgi:hypothetical protein